MRRLQCSFTLFVLVHSASILIPERKWVHLTQRRDEMNLGRLRSTRKPLAKEARLTDSVSTLSAYTKLQMRNGSSLVDENSESGSLEYIMSGDHELDLETYTEQGTKQESESLPGHFGINGKLKDSLTPSEMSSLEEILNKDYLLTVTKDSRPIPTSEDDNDDREKGRTGIYTTTTLVHFTKNDQNDFLNPASASPLEQKRKVETIFEQFATKQTTTEDVSGRESTAPVRETGESLGKNPELEHIPSNLIQNIRISSIPVLDYEDTAVNLSPFDYNITQLKTNKVNGSVNANCFTLDECLYILNLVKSSGDTVTFYNINCVFLECENTLRNHTIRYSNTLDKAQDQNSILSPLEEIKKVNETLNQILTMLTKKVVSPNYITTTRPKPTGTFQDLVSSKYTQFLTDGLKNVGSTILGGLPLLPAAVSSGISQISSIFANYTSTQIPSQDSNEEVAYDYYDEIITSSPQVTKATISKKKPFGTAAPLDLPEVQTLKKKPVINIINNIEKTNVVTEPKPVYIYRPTFPSEVEEDYYNYDTVIQGDETVVSVVNQNTKITATSTSSVVTFLQTLTSKQKVVFGIIIIGIVLLLAQGGTDSSSVLPLVLILPVAVYIIYKTQTASGKRRSSSQLNKIVYLIDTFAEKVRD